MNSASSKKVTAQARTLIHKLNQAWLNRRFNELGRYFHRDMVILSPGSDKQLRGREACVKSYQQSMAGSTVRHYRESNFTVDPWRDTAIVSYRFEISYEWNGKSSRDSGLDVFFASTKRRKVAGCLANTNTGRAEALEADLALSQP